MYNALLVIFLLVAIGLIGLIMMQQGKGADMGSSFNGSTAGTLFGSHGSGSFMTRITAVQATLFFLISLVLGNINSNMHKASQWDNLIQPVAKSQKITPAAKPIIELAEREKNR